MKVNFQFSLNKYTSLYSLNRELAVTARTYFLFTQTNEPAFVGDNQSPVVVYLWISAFRGIVAKRSFSTSTIEPVSNYCCFLFGFFSLQFSQGFRRVVQSHRCGLQLGWDLSTNLGTLNLANVQFLNANFCAFVVPRAFLKFLVSINIFDMTV